MIGGDPATAPRNGAASSSDADIAGALRELGILLRALRRSRYFWICVLLASGIVAVICLNMVGQVRLNVWQGDFFDALEQRNLAHLLHQTLVFFLIIAVLLALVVGETWQRQILEVRAREWLTRDLLDEWVKGKRPYLLAFAGEISSNPDQRMQADALHLTELTLGLGIGLLRSSLLLASFLGVLWVLSEGVVLPGGLHVPGYLVWCALAYAVTGSVLTWWVGRPLIGINSERYAREAELRFALVRISENAEAIALHGGEGDERRALDRPVAAVVAITRRLANAIARLTWITSGYGWLALIVPLLVAAPGYFQGSLSFGGLMMTVGAFNHVQAALRWFVDNFPGIADWRATLLRVASFREALPELDEMADTSGRIAYSEHEGGEVVFDELRVNLLDDQVEFEQPRVELQPGERLLILGRRGVGKSIMFRAMAGIWPWGEGSIQVPPRARLMFIPQRPYLPLASLRAALAYPNGSGRLDDEVVQGALERVGLGHLAPRLDEDHRWDRELTLEEQQRVILARLLLHHPSAVFLDEALSALDADHRGLMRAIFDEELAGTTVVGISSGPGDDDFYSRSIRLRRRRGAARLRPAGVLAGMKRRRASAAGPETPPATRIKPGAVDEVRSGRR